MVRSLEEIVAAALSPKGSGPLPLDAMLHLLSAGHAHNLTVSTIDTTSDNGWIPRPEFYFHIDADQLEHEASDPVQRAHAAHLAAVDFYAGLDSQLDGVEFEVWFWND